MDWTQQNADDIIEGIYSGEYALDRLPRLLFEFTFGAIMPLIEKAFKVAPPPASTKALLLEAFRDNCNVFSGAKTFQEAKDLSNMVFLADGSKRPFKEFAEFAKQIDAQYNLNWLKVEQDAAFARAQAADKWVDIEQQAELLPYLRYNTVGDQRVRPDHAEQDGVTLPVGHPYWDTWFPPNDWGCRCDVDQLDDEDIQITKMDKVPVNDVKLFADNPGKSRIIFRETGHGKHPYFKVEQRYKVLQEDNNFGLGYL